MVGGQITGQLSGFVNTLAPNAQIAKAVSSGKTTTVEQRHIERPSIMDQNMLESWQIKQNHLPLRHWKLLKQKLLIRSIL